VVHVGSNRSFLSPEGVMKIFSTVEAPLWAPNRTDEAAWASYDRLVPTEMGGSLTLNGWLALWHMHCYLDCQLTARYLQLIGYTYFI
jgi:hypothetical protein